MCIINNEDSYRYPNICRQMKIVWEMFTLEKHIYCLYYVDMSLYELIVVWCEIKLFFVSSDVYLCEGLPP